MVIDIAFALLRNGLKMERGFSRNRRINADSDGFYPRKSAASAFIRVPFINLQNMVYLCFRSFQGFSGVGNSNDVAAKSFSRSRVV